ncbi:uncharacterized protein LOC112693732 isoform X2 [Sipha flava]|uniref:Uncharacterized protein LOC112693732 isoform X2 n=1 Tax=Sipha flava TaxID=143950 RepID=A0A8B8GR23_9HEMI|nr:uncharacterized protein LOC112693732 isoform X2 [Sipha flava]
MDNLGNEVIIKVKEAIREKLKEMNANSSDEIIDYIMLLVTTKKSSAELAKSIDFVMENNTNIFVKWLSTIIKKLQQVTVSTTEKNVPENVSKDNKTANKKYQSDDILICETNDVKLDDSNKEKELMFNLNIENRSIKTSDEEKKEKSFELCELEKYDENKISSPVKSNEIRPRICFSPEKIIKTKNNICLNYNNSCYKSLHVMKNTSIKSNSNILNIGDVPNKNNTDGNIKRDVKKKRPRISINSDDEDEKNISIKNPITIKEPAKQITKGLLKKNNKISMSQIIVVKPPESKRIDHQRGALALDTAFKYIQQQIGASDKEITVIKKWRDYAVEMLRHSEKA